jgi:hypothetical protein
MASLKQIEANRRNALKSTGPKTPEGKAAVRMNVLQHGLRARSVVIPGEDPAELRQLCDDLQNEWRPQSRTEQLLVEQMAVAQWKLARLEVGERSIYLQTMGAERQLALLDRFSVQRGRLERSFSRAMKELRELGEKRPAVSRQVQAETFAAQAQPSVPETSYIRSDHGSGVTGFAGYAHEPVLFEKANYI